MEGCCTAPGSTVTFTAFNPCANAATYSVWYLTDSRESTNVQTYKVKKMADGRIWMVQDLKFGNRCSNKTAFTGSTSDQTNSNLTSISGYKYGDCRNNTQARAGYLYDWAAAIQKAGAYRGSSTDVGCSGTDGGISGTNPGACRGICPEGWHIPTGGSAGEFLKLHDAREDCSLSHDNCWDASSQWEGVLGGACYPDGSMIFQNAKGHMYSSTYANSTGAYILYFQSNYTAPGTYADYNTKYLGMTIRCLMNY
jgi:uncharacterized protein (TIGR02145 family)